MKKKKLKIIISIFLIIMIAANFAIANYLLNFATGRDSTSSTSISMTLEKLSNKQKEINNLKKQTREQAAQEAEKRNPQEWDISTENNLTLRSSVYQQNNNNHLWCIVVHGYHSISYNVIDIAMQYYDKGYSTLVPDLRACGKSDGTYQGMGWLDRKDMLQWIDKILKEDPEAKIVLHGVSMGGATVMMTAGEDLPDAVKVVVEDCGYTSVWDIFKKELKDIYGLPPFPLLHTASLLSKIRSNYSFSEASSLKSLAACDIPMLFIHGAEDDFVSTDMVYQVYDADPCDQKQILVVDDARHAVSRFADPDLYWKTVWEFVGAYMK